MTQTTSTIEADFDRIARLSAEGGWNHNNHYHRFLLKHLPPHIAEALDIGCGSGEFTRLLARRAQHVTALDLSSEMIRAAREASAKYRNIEYVQADVMEWAIARERFDVIASIATLHHLPLKDALLRMRDGLKPGGVLLVLDLFKYSTPTEYFFGALAVPADKVLRLVKRAPLTRSPEARRAWEAHGRSDIYPTFKEVLRLCEEVLPGATVQRHLFYRYSIVWKKPRRYFLSSIEEENGPLPGPN